MNEQERPEQQPVDETILRALLLTMASRLMAVGYAEPMTEETRLQLVHALTEHDDPERSVLLSRTVHLAPEATRGKYAEILMADADTLDLVNRYAIAAQKRRDIAQRPRTENEDPAEWRAAEAEAARLWKAAREAGHSGMVLLISSPKPQADG
jgi:hypothetical protein